ncbi:ribonuclease J [Devosia sp. J2-20]|jgi:ribonuclease J|uniref:Ribonuclease J n=1 Tax=Devosia litorisediminis TaxID=2829817 RepID=A0A942EAJ8_9HYPH|nr:MULTISPECIES: ribonuclease J [Devosia]MBS3848355.1 ribonuclease J [Devosia litorisediminis]MCZ4345133.1 ribonuclease J [Devosia neptuniae]WDQ98563.1 ribonuclease J [Devosia sp. J2-20]|tara:strand:- start:439 stop:2112 length:1674 start_codon:yes stop_codon:yes gene_type:complete
MAKTQRDELVFVPLGGVGEIGMNMGAYGFGPEKSRKWIVVDCGVTFGGPDLPGIELIMANPEFLEERADDVLGLILTHSHEDHYGAVLDLWPGFEKPVFATRFTGAMLAAKRAGDGIVENVDLKIMTPGQPFDLGPFTIEAINVAHSIPESNALLISTPIGRVLHTGDWKLDPTPVGNAPTDVERLKKIGEDTSTPLALICDSTNALKDGESPSEAEVAANLAAMIAEAPNRVAVTTFASNVGRVISIVRAAEKAGRQVVMSGRSLHRIMGIARELGMLEGLPPLLDQDAYRSIARNKIVLICTGSQGEARAAIARIARGDHPVIALASGDRMIFSSWAIPGNEREVIDIQNQLIDQGVEVITANDGLVHVTGHPRRDEVRQLYSWVKPDVLVPVHGEAVHLQAHAKLGRESGIAKVCEARNGDMVRLFPDTTLMPAEVRTGELYLDGLVLCTPEESGVKGRRRLSFGGHVVVSLCVNGGGQVVSGPDLVIDGLPETEDESLSDLVEDTIAGVLKSMPPKRRSDTEVLNSALFKAIRNEVNAYWGRKPNVSVFVHRV